MFIDLGTGISEVVRAFETYGMSVEHRTMRNRTLEEFSVTRQKKNLQFALPHEFLSDLPYTAGYKEHVAAYAKLAATRLDTEHPSAFVALNSMAFSVELECASERWGNTALSSLGVEAIDLSTLDVAHCVAIWDYGLAEEFKSKPFLRHEKIVNSLRAGIDNDEIKFYSKEQHPDERQELRLKYSVQSGIISEPQLQSFLRKKVYEFGFKHADPGTEVWSTDPWDLAYLGVTERRMLQTAQILRANGEINILLSGNYATVADGLLKSKQEAAVSPSQPIRDADFGFVKDGKLRAIAERDYDELRRLKSATATKSRFALAGSVIEALLLDVLLTNQNAVSATAAGRKESRPLEKWGLASLLDSAVELGIINKAAQSFGHSVREHRNLVHPGLERTSDLRIDEPEAAIAENVLEIVIRDLSRRN